MSSTDIHAAPVHTPNPSGAQPPSSAPAGNQSGIAAFLAELQASFVAQQPTQAGPSQVLHAQGPGEVLTFAVDIFDFDQTLILSEVEIPQGQDETLLAMPTGEIEVIQGTFQEIAFDEGAVDEADLDSDESSDGSSDGGDTEEMDWQDDDAEDTLGGDSSFWA
ncbi:hypothetical protein EWM64_g10231 [Hericium alpestre]|uniref:Uncharacterized protein n=1 Tax=Hericium alpestre TaxID=135208 RepID=A0A4Y9ZIV3_9AGAM|nr:hypothetical protein EWM64_g10231 [Hericium alpestre]